MMMNLAGRIMQIDVRIQSFAICVTIAIAAGGATWVNPPTAESPPPTVLHGSSIQAAPQSKAVAAPQASSASAAQASGEAALGSGVTVARWEFSPTTPLQPVYLSMTLYGTQAAIDRMQIDPPLTIQVRWVRDNAGWAPGDLNLVTDLTIGGPGLAAALDNDARRKGFFEWRTWARKDYLSPGAWTVSVTYPDGQPLACGPEAQPCRFTINVG
jgi:hypothetical protein